MQLALSSILDILYTEIISEKKFVLDERLVHTYFNALLIMSIAI